MCQEILRELLITKIFEALAAMKHPNFSSTSSQSNHLALVFTLGSAKRLFDL